MNGETKMADMEKNLPEEENLEAEIITLIDEETGKEQEFELLDRAEIDGNLYFALAIVGDESDEYVILKAHEDGEDIVFESIEDDDEFEKAEEYFTDVFFNEIDYDQQ